MSENFPLMWSMSLGHDQNFSFFSGNGMEWHRIENISIRHM